jgi:hypothetical protein
MTGKVGHEEPMPTREPGGQLGPVGGSPAEAVDEDERWSLPADEIPHTDALELGETLLQPG